MKTEIKKRLSIYACIMLIIMLFPANVKADVGPKPSVRITFQGLGDELCYGTLLSLRDSTGPSSAWDGMDAHARHNENEDYYYADLDYATWKAFAEYEDLDGYYFLQEGWQINETKELAWTYYPPSSFKILLYFPEQNVFVTSGIYERYAFDSYYTVDMSEIEITGDFDTDEIHIMAKIMDARKSYDYGQEIASLCVRIVATILIEICIAFLFGFRKKKELLFLACVNIFTQIVLNVLLNIINYNAGQMAFTFAYILLEIAVFTIEAILYCIFIPSLSEKPKKKGVYMIYALAANAGSFVAGFAIAKAMPGIF